MPSEKFRYLSPNNNRKKKHISTSKWCFIEPQAATCIPTILAILVRHIRSLPSKTWTSKPIRLFDVEGGCASCLIHVRLQRPTYRKYWRQSACLPILANQNVKRGGNLLLVNYSCHAQHACVVHSQYRRSRALAWTTGQHQRFRRPIHYGIPIVGTVILTNEAQPPTSLVTKDGLSFNVLNRNHGQKRLGCILMDCGN